MTWHEDIARQLGSHHSDTLAVIRAGKKGAKKRTNRKARRQWAPTKNKQQTDTTNPTPPNSATTPTTSKTPPSRKPPAKDAAATSSKPAPTPAPPGAPNADEQPPE